MGNRFHVDYVLRLGDSALVHAQRLAEWCGHGPVLEEDIALANIALDHLGQARLLLAHAGALEGGGRNEDVLAFLRDAGEYRNFTLLELPNGEPGSGGSGGRDYAFTIARSLLFSAYQCALWQRLRDSRDAELAAIAGKSLKEARYHFHHAADWSMRLGDGTGESRERMQRALDALFPYAGEFFTDDAVDMAAVAAGIGVPGGSLEPAWRQEVAAVLESATLSLPAARAFRSAGKSGTHSEHLGHLLTDMQFLQRAYPGAQW